MNVGLQLYSMRACADQIALLDDLALMNIKSVEGYGGVYSAPAAYRAAMDANGITMPSGHMSLEDIEGDFEGTLRLTEALGIKHVFAPYLQEHDRPTTSAGYVSLAKRLADAGRKYTEAGLGFGWHNHDFEFVALADGGIPMDILLEEAPDMTWEADLAWVIKGGRDPLEYIARYGSRMASVHVKDIALEGTNLDEDGWSDLGAGTMDWAALLQACRSQAPNLLYILEHDNPADPKGYVARSASAFNTLWENTRD